MSGDERAGRARVRAIAHVAGCEVDVLVGDVCAVTSDLAIIPMGSDDFDSARACADAGAGATLRRALARLRTEGVFTAALGETLLVPTSALPIRADALMMLGLGGQNGGCLEIGRAVRVAAEQAIRMGLRHAAVAIGALAPRNGDASGCEGAILTTLRDALVARPGRVRRWSFVVAADGFADTADRLSGAWADLL